MTDDSMLIKDSATLDAMLHKNVRCMVLFGRRDCLHCSIMETIMDNIRDEYPTIEFGYIVDDGSVGDGYGVMQYPTIVFFECGHVLGSLVGSERCGSLKSIVNTIYCIK